MIYSSKKYNANLIAFLASRVLNKTSKNLLFHNLYSLLTSHKKLILHNSKTNYYKENSRNTTKSFFSKYYWQGHKIIADFF